MAIEESLNLDVSAAIDAIRNDLGSEIDALPKRLQTAFADLDVAALMGELGAEIDTLGDRLQAGFTDLDLSAAAAAIRDEIGAQVDEIPGQLQLGFDGLDVSGAAAAISGGIGTEIDQLPRQLELGLAEVDVKPAAAAIDETISPVIDALGTRLQEAFMGLEDSGAFQGLNQAIEDLGNVMASLGKTTDAVINGPSGGGGGGGLSAMPGVLATVASSTSRMRESVVNLGGPTVIAVTSLTAAVGAFAADALNATSATNSFNLRVGDLAGALNRVNFAGFNEDLSTFAIRIGADDDAMRLALAKIVDLSVGSNKTRQEVGALGQEFTALAGYLSVTNPSLGTADQLLQSLPNVLARGGRSLANYGIALSATDINQRAVTDSGGKAVEELTIFDKAAAGLALTMEQLGPSFDKNFNKALEDPKNQLRSLRTAVSEAGEAAAKPLIKPLIDSLKELQPSLVIAAETIGTVGTAFVSVLGPAVAIVAPLLTEIATAVDAMPDPVVALAAGVLLLGQRFGLTAISARAASIATGEFAVATEAASTSVLGPIGLVIGLKVLADYLDKTVLGIKKTDEVMTEAFAQPDATKQVEALKDAVLDLQFVIDKTNPDQPGFLKDFKELAETDMTKAAELRDELARSGYEVERLTEIMVKAGYTTSETAQAASGFANLLINDLNPALEYTELTTDQLNAKFDLLDKMLRAQTEAVALASAPWKAYAANMTDAGGAASRLNEELFGLSNREGEVANAFVEMANATKDNGASLDLATEAGRKNAGVLQDLITKGTAWIGTIYEGEGASINFANAHAAVRTQLENVLRQLGYNDAAIASYVGMWDLVPREVETNVVIKVSTIFPGASKGEEQKYFDQVDESMGQGTPESQKRLAENAYDLTPPADTKAKTANDIKTFINGVLDDVSHALIPKAEKTGAAGGKALTDGIAAGITDNIDPIYKALSDMFDEFSKIGGSQIGPLNAQVGTLAKGFAAGASFSQAQDRVAAAVGQGLFDQSTGTQILQAIMLMFIDALNKDLNGAGSLIRGAGLSGFVYFNEATGKYMQNSNSVRTRFAQGGIARPGQGVMFNEPGTGGEAFIPLGSNRARATSILGEVASRFGYTLMPARGAVSAGPAMGGAALDRIGDLLESLPERLPRALTVTAPIDNVSYGDAHDVSAQVVANVQRTLAGIGIGVATRQGRR